MSRLVDGYDDFPFMYIMEEIEEILRDKPEEKLTILTERILAEFLPFNSYKNPTNNNSNLPPPSTHNTLLKCLTSGCEIPKKVRVGGRKKMVIREENCVRLFANAPKPKETNGFNFEHKQKKQKTNNNDTDEPVWPSVLRRTIEEKGGSEVHLVITKKLTKTDVSEVQGRVSIPINQMNNVEFLREHEKRTLSERECGRHCKGIDVMLIGPSESDDLKGTKLKLKKWDMHGNSSHYNIVSGWYSKVVRNNIKLLQNNPTLQFWTFRDNADQLWFQLVIVRDNGEESASSTISAAGDHQTTASS